MTSRIDVNCDLGEDPAMLARDLHLLQLVSSINIACGGHAGDDASMQALTAAAQTAGCAIGAHPSYPDRANFGRAPMQIALTDLEQTLAAQIAALGTIARRSGAELTHVKPHGALYHAAMHDPDIAAAIARAASAWDPRLILVGQAGAPSLKQWQRDGFRTAAEAFADRRYDSPATLRPRSMPGAVLADPAEAAAQALSICRDHRIPLGDSSTHPLKADTLCIHSDTPQALEIARAVRDALSAAGIAIQPLR